MIEAAYGYRLLAPGEPLEHWALPPLEPGDGEVVVAVAGCGVCHTDVSFAIDGVPTRHPLPLILGHEVSGRVVEAGAGASQWLGRRVIVPAVVPCGECAACRGLRPTICRRQFMPGNHGHGGFATHLKVPAHGLCPVPEELPGDLSLPLLSVIADAVTTPLEAIHRSGLDSRDVAVFVGAGGVGGFGVQIAAALGAAVVAIDIDPERLRLAGEHGAALTLEAGADPRELKQAVREFAGRERPDALGLRVFETSGTPQGQLTAFALLTPGSHLGVVGFTPARIELRLSNLMALDSRAEGNWGSAPERYPEALQLVLDGKVTLPPYVETRPLDQAPEVLAQVARHELRRRAILVPQGGPT